MYEKSSSSSGEERGHYELFAMAIAALAFIAAVTVLAIGIADDSDAAPFTHGNVNYEVIGETTTVKVVGSDGSANLTIPASFIHNSVTYTVVQIAQNAFYNAYYLDTMDIQATNIEICGMAFSQTSLKEITIADNATIRTEAFYKCDFMTYLRLGNGARIDNDGFAAPLQFFDVDGTTPLSAPSGGNTYVANSPHNLVKVGTDERYTITFLDGARIFAKYQCKANAVIQGPDNIPVKDPVPGDVFTFSFDRWGGYADGMKATGNMTFRAEYTATATSIDTAPAKLRVQSDVAGKIALSQSLVDQIKTADKMTEFSLENGSITLNDTAVASLPSTNMTIGIQKKSASALPEADAKKVGDRPVYDVTIGDLHSFGGQKLDVRLNYVLKEGEKAQNIYVLYLKGDGTQEKIQASYLDTDKCVSFETDHLSQYAIMCDNSTPSDNFNVGLVIGGAVAAIAVIGIAVFFVLKGKH